MTAPFPKEEIEGSIAERFRRAARAHPNRPAVSEAGRTVTYAELEARAAAVAAALVRSPPRSEPRSAGRPRARAGAPLFAAMLGRSRPGASTSRSTRRCRMRGSSRSWRDLDAAAVVTEVASSARTRALAPAGVSVLELETLLAGPATAAAAASTASVSAGDLAYVLFTSGSTGRPKGVMQSHRNVLHNVWKLASGLAIGPEDRITLLSSVRASARRSRTSTGRCSRARASAPSIFPATVSGDCPISWSARASRSITPCRASSGACPRRSTAAPTSRAPDAQARRRGRARHRISISIATAFREAASSTSVSGRPRWP